MNVYPRSTVGLAWQLRQLVYGFVWTMAYTWVMQHMTHV